MTIYDEAQADAAALLAEMKQGTMVLERAATSTVSPDPWDGAGSGPATWPLEGTAVGVDADLVDGKDILITDLELTVAAFGGEPKVNDTIAIDGTPHKVQRVRAVPPAGTVVVWKLIVRR